LGEITSPKSDVTAALYTEYADTYSYNKIITDRLSSLKDRINDYRIIFPSDNKHRIGTSIRDIFRALQSLNIELDKYNLAPVLARISTQVKVAIERSRPISNESTLSIAATNGNLRKWYIAMQTMVLDINKLLVPLNILSNILNKPVRWGSNKLSNDSLIKVLKQKIEGIDHNLMAGGMFCRNRTRSKRNRKNNTMKLRFIY
jgi:hypothetical protein